ncbi:hypothetical protein BT69DRAFT_1280649, partial [Atractiella rhizophila]
MFRKVAFRAVRPCYSHKTFVRPFTHDISPSSATVSEPESVPKAKEIPTDSEGAREPRSRNILSQMRSIDRRNEILQNISRKMETWKSDQAGQKMRQSTPMIKWLHREGKRRRIQRLIEERKGQEEKYPHQCPHCDLRLKKKGALAAHVQRFHTKTECFFCTGCGSMFATKYVAAVHLSRKFAPQDCRSGRVLRVATKEEDSQWICSGCETAFESEPACKGHQERNTQCSGTRRIFVPSVKEILYTNYSNSDEVKNYFQCPKCSARYAAMSSLYTHYSKHAGDRRICSGCKKLYTSATGMWHHQRRSANCTHKPWYHLASRGAIDRIVCLGCGKHHDDWSSFDSHKKSTENCRDADFYLIPALQGD